MSHGPQFIAVMRYDRPMPLQWRYTVCRLTPTSSASLWFACSPEQKKPTSESAESCRLKCSALALPTAPFSSRPEMGRQRRRTRCRPVLFQLQKCFGVSAGHWVRVPPQILVVCLVFVGKVQACCLTSAIRRTKSPDVSRRLLNGRRRNSGKSFCTRVQQPVPNVGCILRAVAALSETPKRIAHLVQQYVVVLALEQCNRPPKPLDSHGPKCMNRERFLLAADAPNEMDAAILLAELDMLNPQSSSLVGPIRAV